MASELVTSAFVMGLLAAIVIGALARSRQWYRHQPGSAAASETGWSPAGHDERSRSDGMAVWVALFLVLALGAVAGVAVFVSSAAAPSGLLSGPIVVLGALVVGLYMALGVYVTAKQRGHPRSIAAAETATVCGALFLLAVAAQLIGA